MMLVVPIVMTVVNSSLVVELRIGRVDSSVVPGLDETPGVEAVLDP